jgi:glycosyltransferase involved in cell wall biosynthesis
VLFVIDNLDISGAEKAALSVLRQCKESDQIEARGVVCMDNKLGGVLGDPMIENLGLGHAPGGSLVKRGGRAIALMPRLARLCAWADIVVPVTPPAALLAAVAGAMATKPVAPWVHYDLDGLQREALCRGRRLRDWLMLQLYRRFVPSFRRLLFASEQTRKSFLVRACNSAPGKNWIVLPYVYDATGFSEGPSHSVARVSALKKQGKPLLMFLGRVVRQKRWEDAVSMAELLVARGRTFNLVFVGDGVENDLLQSRVSASPARESIHLLGADPNPMPALALADALVMTSRFEAWPLVILESFSLGVPVFSYECPSGPAEMLGRQRERGILVREAPDEMASALDSWFWIMSKGDRSRESMRMTAATEDFLMFHRPESALPKWAAGLSSLIGR